MHARLYHLALLAIAILAPLAPHSFAEPPDTPRRPVTDTYHGVAVIDDYRWLENWDDPQVKSWSEAQNVHTRSVLDALPDVEPIRARITQIMSAPVIRYGALHREGGRLFAIKFEPPKQQPFIVVMESADKPETERVLVDPNVIDPDGTTSIDWYFPSPDGKLLAVSLSHGGSESGDVHLFDAATGKATGEVVPRVNGGTAGGWLAWTPDSRGFYYSRYPRAGERPEEDMAFYTQVYYHALGAPTDKDRYEIGKEFPRIAEIQLEVNKADGRVLATIQNGDGGEFAFYVKGLDGTWTQVADYPDRIVQGTFAPGNSLFLISRAGAPRGKILRLPLDNPSLSAASTIVPEGKDTIVSGFWDPSTLVATPGRLYLTYQLGGPSEIRVFDHAGKALAVPQQLPVASADGVTPLEGDDVLYSNVSYIEPAAWYHLDAKTGQTRRTALAVKAPVDFSDCEVVREFATSKDGTKVPVNIVRRKGLKLDGSHPCLITGYGGYGVNITPAFSSVDRVLVEQGFVLAECNLRGGGEYGDEWHRQGSLEHKQNVFDDFAASVKHMQEKGYTNPRKTAILGGSNGGLLMGAAFTQHPQMARVVISLVGIYDMLRVELSPNGAFNVPEFGTVKDEEQFKALHAYSPYHNVKDGTRYPAILFMTGANDPRVDPMQSRKMTARLQAANPGGVVLLRTSGSTGHGGGTPLNARIEQTTDWMAFLFHHLEVPYKPVN